MEHKKSLFLGIDAGKHTGICIWDTLKKCIVEIKTTDFLSLIFKIEHWQNECKKNDSKLEEYLCVYVESPSLNKPIFIKKYEPKNVKCALKIAQDVGRNKREAELLITYFKNKGYKVVEYKPTTKKWTKKQFQQITNFKGRVSQHAIDACKMVFGL